MLADVADASYDAGHDPRVAEALMNDREAKTISEVAAILRAEIIAGKYSGRDEKVPSRNRIAGRFGISPESGGVVLRMLLADGLIRMVQGSGTYAEPVRRYRAVVTARRAGGGEITAGAFGAAGKRLRSLDDADLSDLHADAPAGDLEIALVVIAADAGYAAGRASAAARSALGSEWEITGASAVEARPVDGD